MNGFNLNATILNVLAPNSVLDMRGGTLSVTVFLWTVLFVFRS
jgi:hypothetical protein